MLGRLPRLPPTSTSPLANQSTTHGGTRTWRMLSRLTRSTFRIGSIDCRSRMKKSAAIRLTATFKWPTNARRCTSTLSRCVCDSPDHLPDASFAVAVAETEADLAFQVVPTSTQALGQKQPFFANQYSVTEQKTVVNHKRGSGGLPGIYFKCVEPSPELGA